MAAIQIIVGSVLGASEYVADALAEFLSDKGHQVTIHLSPELADIEQQDYWLICSSTHGAGDLPDNIQPFADELAGQDLKQLPYCVIALGDSSYDTFCQAGNTLNTLMQSVNAKPLANVVEIDVLQHPIPEDIAVEWLTKHHVLFSA